MTTMTACAIPTTTDRPILLPADVPPMVGCAVPAAAPVAAPAARIMTVARIAGPQDGRSVIVVNLGRPVTAVVAAARPRTLPMRRHGLLHLDGEVAAASFDRAAELLVIDAPALDGVPPGPRVAEPDELLRGLAQGLRRESRMDGTADTDFTAMLVATVVARAARLLARQARTARQHTTRLQPYKVKQIRAYVEANLAEPFRLDTLAAIACVSRYHFCRSFKMATGMTPLQFVTQIRVERCRDMILGSDDGLASISAAGGFASQSHMTTTMRKVLGITPGRLRRLPAGDGAADTAPDAAAA